MISALVQSSSDQGGMPHIGRQWLADVSITSAKVMVSITCLAFSYTQASTSMKSFVMALFLISMAQGNLLTSSVNFLLAPTLVSPNQRGWLVTGSLPC
jgi:POT family proton-dependent oligopeptide transporter